MSLNSLMMFIQALLLCRSRDFSFSIVHGNDCRLLKASRSIPNSGSDSKPACLALL